jgi:site-specific DNA recombinase
MPGMTAVVIYCRISRDRDGTGLGVERQEADCRALADRLGLTVGADSLYVDNDISAYSGKRRPAYEKMMDLAEAGKIGVILAYSTSRLTRQHREFLRLIDAYKQHGVRIHTVSSGQDDLSTADGRHIAWILATNNVAESERISERTRRAKQQARELGRPHGGPRPYGWGPVVGTGTKRNRITGEMEAVDVRDYSQVIPEEAEIIAECAQAVISGQSLTGLVRNLNARGVPTPTGGQWATRGLRRTLLRPHPATANVFEALKLFLNDKDRITTPGPARRWMLTGLATCGVCGSPMRGSGSSKGAGLGTYPAYKCTSGKHIVINAVTLDEFITVKTLAYITEKLTRRESGEEKPATVDTGPLRAEADELMAQLADAANDLGLDVDILKRGKGRQAERLRMIELQLATANMPDPLDEFAGLNAWQKLDLWDSIDLDRRRVVIRSLMTIQVGKGAKGVIPRDRRWRPELPSFDPQRVKIRWL